MKQTKQIKNHQYIKILKMKYQSILDKRHQLKISKYQPLITIQVSTFTISSGGTIHKEAIELIK